MKTINLGRLSRCGDETEVFPSQYCIAVARYGDEYLCLTDAASYVVYLFDPVTEDGVVQPSDDILSLQGTCRFRGIDIHLSLPDKLFESLKKRDPRTIVGLLLPETHIKIIDHYIERNLDPQGIDEFTRIMEIISSSIDTEECIEYYPVKEKIKDTEIENLQNWIRNINRMGYNICYCGEKMRHGIIMNDKCVIPRWE